MLSLRSLSMLLMAMLFLASCKQQEKSANAPAEAPSQAYDYALVLHGGAGYMNFENLPEERQGPFMQALDSALQLGLDLLDGGGSSLDAVEAVSAGALPLGVAVEIEGIFEIE